MFLVELIQQEIDIHRLLRAVSHPDAGGEVLFLGTTRRFTASGSACCCGSKELGIASTHSNQVAGQVSKCSSEIDGKSVDLAENTKLEMSVAQGQQPEVSGVITEYLVYEAHETMALKQMNQLARQAAERWPLKAVAIVHRLGKVLPEEASIAIAVSSPHRSEAYEASRWLIDSIKRDVPIWKQEYFSDQSANWVHPEWQEASECSGTKS